MTLIELMIVVAVVAILASIAVPGYRNHILRTHRVEARAALLGLAAAQEKFYLVNHTYATSLQLSVAPPGGLGLPVTSEGGRYTITIAGGANATGFSATATAVGAQAADGDCSTFTINHLGVKSATRSDGSPSPRCWY